MQVLQRGSRGKQSDQFQCSPVFSCLSKWFCPHSRLGFKTRGAMGTSFRDFLILPDLPFFFPHSSRKKGVDVFPFPCYRTPQCPTPRCSYICFMRTSMFRLARLSSCYTSSRTQLKPRGHQPQRMYWFTVLKDNICLTHELIFLKRQAKMPGEVDTNLLFLPHNALHPSSISRVFRELSHAVSHFNLIAML